MNNICILERSLKMGLFDNLKRQAMSQLNSSSRQAMNSVADAAKNSIRSMGNKKESFTFNSIPASLGEFTSLPYAGLSTPFETAAMTVIALCVYPYNAELSFEMLNFLRGPRPLGNQEKSFIKDRFYEVDYVPRSYFDGSVPENDYNPPEPYTITVFNGPYSYQNEGYAKLFIRSGGADNPREVLMRMTKDGKWYLWDQFLLPGIREPHGANPWA